MTHGTYHSEPRLLTLVSSVLGMLVVQVVGCFLFLFSCLLMLYHSVHDTVTHPPVGRVRTYEFL